jgi:hypothetical protein
MKPAIACRTKLCIPVCKEHEVTILIKSLIAMCGYVMSDIYEVLVPLRKRLLSGKCTKFFDSVGKGAANIELVQD